MINKKQLRFSENLLQWIWQQMQFSQSGLRTTKGVRVEIISQGEINHGSGPDFKNAEIVMNGIRWFGSIEIHNSAGEWYEHGHDMDPGFNSVILHVVFEESNMTVKTQTGEEPFTLCLKPYLHKSLAELLQLKEESRLPCSGSLTFINQQAFQFQIDKAHKEYFDYKLNELLEMYSPRLIPSRAWKECFILQIYKTLGIPSNKESMAGLFRLIRQDADRFSDFKKWNKYVTEIAFPSQTTQPGPGSLQWVHTGMRPASRPEIRVVQAAALHLAILHTPIGTFLKEGTGIWPALLNNIPSPFRAGSQRRELIRSTVFLPALYLMGKLFHDQNLMNQSFKGWLADTGQVPSEVAKPFLKAGFTLNKPVKKSGLAHQYKRYCLKRQCHHCEVFKSAIRS